ncbi:hypothetical protein M9H77_23654 [Catharanthus roseus]|uniref:Uncharacterized protein n=1 Tax=Catharanthus roseus TaxID=4058 RepID=A0ACC0AUB8_CATRO|nr:hypothetical protein M9H77_23654 [Catharanthus roseus]
MIARLESEIVRTKLRIKTSLYTKKLRKRKNLLSSGKVGRYSMKKTDFRKVVHVAQLIVHSVYYTDIRKLLFPTELMQAVEPFLYAAQEALPQVPADTAESFHFPIEMNNRVVVPTNSNLRDIARTGTISFPLHPTSPPGNYGLELIPGIQSPVSHQNANHYPSGSSQEAHQRGGSKEALCYTRIASS